MQIKEQVCPCPSSVSLCSWPAAAHSCPSKAQQSHPDREPGGKGGAGCVTPGRWQHPWQDSDSLAGCQGLRALAQCCLQVPAIQALHLLWDRLLKCCINGSFVGQVIYREGLWASPSSVSAPVYQVTAPTDAKHAHPVTPLGFELVAAFMSQSLTCPGCRYKQLVFLGTVAVMALNDNSLFQASTIPAKISLPGLAGRWVRENMDSSAVWIHRRPSPGLPWFSSKINSHLHLICLLKKGKKQPKKGQLYKKRKLQIQMH